MTNPNIKASGSRFAPIYLKQILTHTSSEIVVMLIRFIDDNIWAS